VSGSGDRCMEKRYEIARYVNGRIKEFKTLGKEGQVIFDFRPFLNLRFRADILSELAFCISTANSSAKSGLLFQRMFYESKFRSVEDIRRMMVIAKVRFPKTKAKYISSMMEKFPDIVKVVNTFGSKEARELLVKNIKGLGYKEASHFLRNTGRDDVAILDRHILRWLKGKGYLDRIPKTLTRKKYMEVESIMEEIASEEKMRLSELDLHIWYSKTGKVLK